MPIQNIGTLLENIVLTETAGLIGGLECEQSRFLEFVNAFAMPPQSEWRPHRKNNGFEDAVLDRLALGKPFDDSTSMYARLLQANLRAQRTLGPNAAMLVMGAWSRRRFIRMWLNDVPDGHYGDCIADLKRIEEIAQATYSRRFARDCLELSVSATPYPRSIADLQDCLAVWSDGPPPAARLAFLDPMRYRIANRGPADTSSNDHRSWLIAVRSEALTLALHFTGNSDHPSLNRELDSLQKDSIGAGYLESVCFAKEHYAVFIAINDSSREKCSTLSSDLERHVQEAWADWFHRLKPGSYSALRIARNGVPVG